MRIDIDMGRIERSGISTLVTSLTDSPSKGELCEAMVRILERRKLDQFFFELDLEGASEPETKAAYYAVERAEQALIETPGNIWAIYLCKLLLLEIASVGFKRFSN